MRKYIIALCLVTTIIGCAKTESDVSIILSQAAVCMESCPDSSLNMLEKLQMEDLASKKEKASFALLKSIALDKNYIDVTSDSLTALALAYFKDNGSYDDRMKAYYYNGLVFWNRNDYEKAMDNYLRAEQYVGKCKDYVSVGRLYNAKMLVYNVIMNMEKAEQPAQLSASFYLKGKDTVRYITALNNLSSVYLVLDKFDSLERCFSKIRELDKHMTDRQRSNYYSNILNYKAAISDSTICKTTADYVDFFRGKENLVRWEYVVRSYLKMGNLDKAEEAVRYFNKYNKGRNNSGTYHFEASKVYENKRDFENAYKNLKIYLSAVTSKDYNVLKSDTKFLEERYASQTQVLKHRFWLVIILLVLVIIVLIALFALRLYRNRCLTIEDQQAQLVDQYEKALSEKKRLKSIIAKSTLNESMKKVIEERLNILNKFIVSGISGMDMEKSLGELKFFLENNELFLKSTVMSFELTHPGFISFLNKKGLTDWEVGCCCLYCIGLNGNEISNYLNVKYFYKSSSIIRKKLGIGAMNIDKFLKSKLNEYH